MSTATATAPHAVPTDVRTTFWHLLRSEWIKLWTLRSTWWVVVLTVLLQAGFTWMVTFFGTREATGDGVQVEAVFSDPVEIAPTYLTAGLMLGQLVICVLAVLTITGEYSTGSIRSTLAAAPRRLDALAAKGLIMLVVAFLTGAAATLLSWALTAPLLADTPLDLGLEMHRRVLIAVPLYLVGIALFAFAIGALLRHSAAALATVFGVLLVLETLVTAIRGVRILELIAPFLPSNAGVQVLSTSTESIESLRAASDVAVLTPWQGYGVLIAWGVVLCTVAALLLRKRDA